MAFGNRVDRLRRRRGRAFGKAGKPLDLAAFASAVYAVVRKRGSRRSRKGPAAAGLAVGVGAAGAALVRRARKRRTLEPLAEEPSAGAEPPSRQEGERAAEETAMSRGAAAGRGESPAEPPAE
jgi:hypothetical protein